MRFVTIMPTAWNERWRSFANFAGGKIHRRQKTDSISDAVPDNLEGQMLQFFTAESRRF